MKILITGVTGFVGQKLLKLLVDQGHECIGLTRNIYEARSKLTAPCELFSWNPEIEEAPLGALEKADAIVHLAGESVGNNRWSPAIKNKIRGSRELGTRNLVSAIAKTKSAKNKILVSASAIGFYGNRSNELLDESSSPGTGFLSDVCQIWEKEIFAKQNELARVVAIRIGIVLGLEGGALTKLLPIFNLGAGGPVGFGKQWMSWIHVDDLIGIISHALQNSELNGPVNGVAPQPVTNKDFSHALGHALKRPAFMPAPSLALKVALGEMSCLVLDSQNVSAKKIIKSGYQFKFKTISEALENLAIQYKKKSSELITEQWIPFPLNQTFDFFSEAENLEKITPPFLQFKVLKKSTDQIQNGTVIDYKLKLKGLPIRWTSLIENFDAPNEFVDSQIRGPYALWHHTHKFIPLQNGTLVQDHVKYKLPLGFLGNLFGGFFVRRDINQIFKYRQQALADIFYKNEN